MKKEGIILTREKERIKQQRNTELIKDKKEIQYQIMKVCIKILIEMRMYLIQMNKINKKKEKEKIKKKRKTKIIKDKKEIQYQIMNVCIKILIEMMMYLIQMYKINKKMRKKKKILLIG